MRKRKEKKENIKMFEELMEEEGGKKKREKVEEFVNRKLDVGGEIKNWENGDWKENKEFLENIKENNIKEWEKDINIMWKNISRKMDEEVSEKKEL